jgi:hypothetical protein
MATPRNLPIRPDELQRLALGVGRYASASRRVLSPNAVNHFPIDPPVETIA